MMKINKKTLVSFIVALLVLGGNFLLSHFSSEKTTTTVSSSSGIVKIKEAYTHHKSDIQVQGSGRVIKVLRDDLKGHKHQKFLLDIGLKKPILIAHNIDLAPKLVGLKKGDRVEFNGEYEYTQKGGVVHWTHHAPRKRHKDGWLRYNGKIYE